MSDPRPLHRLFGLSWIDFFQGTSITVETEIDLSLKQQFLDLVLLRKGTEPIPRPLPDGFEDLAAHNLLTFKSHELFKVYSEDSDMPDKLKEFVRQSIDNLLASLPAEELRRRLSTEERLEGLPAEERLKGLSADEVAKALPPEVLEELARRLKANGSEPKSS